MTSLFTNTLLQNIAQLFNKADDYDVSINVGEENDSETFEAHSVILRARSTYFRTALSPNWVKRKNDKIIFTKPNISPKVFRKILKYIYTGDFSLMDDNIQDEFLDLLIAADELILPELVKYMEEYIITYERDWIQKHLANNIFVTSYKYESFTKLWKYFCELLAQQPNTIFTSSSFILLNKSILLDFIKREDLNIKEIEIWKNLIKWAREQEPKLDKKDFKGLRERLIDFIPYIRFFDITRDEYILEVQPYEKILPNNLNDELKKFFNSNDNSPPKNSISTRYPILQSVPNSGIISNKHLALLSSWIDSMDNDDHNFNLLNNHYEFNLLLRGSRDGFKVKEFHEHCVNKGPTLIVIKIKETNQIVGGYNPISWRSNNSWEKSDETFIFSLGKGKDFNDIILSRVKYGGISVYNSSHSLLGFQDLNWFEGTYKRNYYEKEIMKGRLCKFKVEEYEVFQVVNRLAQEDLEIIIRTNVFLNKSINKKDFLYDNLTELLVSENFPNHYMSDVSPVFLLSPGKEFFSWGF
ncbi:hypothetical protein C1645_802084 [Glomus cerebriforme]|uniref:BTB/POZ domain-containing protein n=1 Tax=Glomus cerebriforme TaxID=658196 RepID=A0A397TJ96_9GLOM|nr:hypothetical protein C1645_802084 [Glomus cerebriforme]